MDRGTANTLPGSVCCAALGSCWASVSPPTSSWTGNSPIASSFGMPMADMPESMAVLGVIKPLILDLPTALGSVIQHATADFCDRGIGEPERFNDLTVRFLLTVEQDTYGFPAQSFPRVEVVGIPKLDAIGPVTEGEFGSLGTKTFLCRGQQLGQVGFQASHNWQAEIASGM